MVYLLSMTIVDLNTFLKAKGSMLIFYSNDHLVKTKTDYPELVQDYFFFFQDYKILDPKDMHKAKVFVGDNELDLNHLKKVFLLARERFYQLTEGIPFPDIIISNEKKTPTGAISSYSDKTYYHDIILNSDFLATSSVEEIMNVIGHELGHLFIYQAKPQLNITVNMWPKKIFDFLVLYILISPFLILFSVSDMALTPALLTITTSFLIMVYFLFPSLYKIKKRFKRYGEEFFADDFASIFLKPKKHRGNLSLINYDSHPSNYIRYKRQKTNKMKNIQELVDFWKSQNNKVNFWDIFFSPF